MRDRLRFASEQWGLTALQVIYQRERKAVWSAESERYGPVILKWDAEGGLCREYRMLSRLEGRRSCKVYEYDEAKGLLLEERIVPGTVLRAEPSLEKRVEALAEVFREIHQPEHSGESYLDWLDGVWGFCASGGVPGELCRMAEQARKVCRELFRRYPERLLLHGDLHHDNLLLRADGSYLMIDPKGIVGPGILDLPRFLLNEADFADGQEHMRRAVRLVGEACGCPEEALWKGLFLEAVLANLWLLEDGLPMNARWLDLARLIAGHGLFSGE